MLIVQVKSGHVKSGDIRDLVGTLRREGGAIGVFITLEKATSHMTDEAASAGFFTSQHFAKFPRIQILTQPVEIGLVISTSAISPVVNGGTRRRASLVSSIK